MKIKKKNSESLYVVYAFHFENELVTFSASLLKLWSVLELELLVSSLSEVHSVSPSLPSNDPASSERPTHHSPSLPSQSREGPTAKPRGSSVDRNVVRADGRGGARPAINLQSKHRNRLQAEIRPNKMKIFPTSRGSEN